MDEQQLFCAYHPNRPTSLRCNRCGRPICTECAVLTPVGYRCKTCVREQQKVFETAYWYDFAVAFVVAGVICGAGSILTAWIGIFALIVAGFVGSIAARAVQWAVRHRRSRYMWLAAVAGGIAGCVPSLIPSLIYLLLIPGQSGLAGWVTAGISILLPVAYMLIAVSFLAANVRGLHL
jgi:hypothetical protein